MKKWYNSVNYIGDLKLIRKKILVLGGFILGTLLWLMVFIGQQIEKDSTPRFNIGTFVFLWICISLIVILLSLFCTSYRVDEKKFNLKIMLISWGIIFGSYIPWWIAAFPGVFSYDAPHQLYQFVTHNIGNNQPVVSSLFLYVVMTFGKIITGSYDGAVGVYIFFQLLFASLTFSYCVEIIRKTGGWLFYLLSMLFFMFYPPNFLLVVNVGKDTLYAFFILWDIILLIKVMKNLNYGESVSKRLLVLMGLFFLLSLFWRNNTVYAFIILVAIALLIYRKRWKQILFFAAVILLPYYIITGPLYDKLGVQNPHNLVESMAIPEQTMIYAYILHGDEFKENEIAIMNSVYFDSFSSIEECIGSYHQENSDYIRPHMNDVNMRRIGMSEFLKTWIDIGIRYPKDYLKAILANTAGYWYPFHSYTGNGSDKYVEYTNSTYAAGVHTERKNYAPRLSSLCFSLGEKFTESMDGHPILEFVFSSACTLWLLIFAIYLIIIKRVPHLVLPAIFLSSIMITIFAGPLSLVRYIYPISVSLPLLYAEVVGYHPRM